MNKAIMFCKKYNIPYTVETLNSGYNRIAIQCTPNDFSAVYSTVNKANKNKWYIDIHAATFTIFIHNKAEYEESQKVCNARMILVELFYLELRKHNNQELAKKAQYEYAIKHDCIIAFESIYNR